MSGGLPSHRNLAIRVFTLTFSLFVGQRFTDCTNGYRAYRTSMLRDERLDWTQDWLGSYELEYYIHYKAIQLGYRVEEVPVAKVYRQPSADGSYSKMRARDWLVALKPLLYLRLGLKQLSAARPLLRPHRTVRGDPGGDPRCARPCLQERAVRPRETRSRASSTSSPSTARRRTASR